MMILNVYVAEQSYQLDVPEHLLTEAESLFAKMDEDMNQGWQMSRQWVDTLDIEQRCQVAADRLLTALENENQAVSTMMAAYILKRAPGVTGVRIDTEGEIQETELLRGDK